MDRIMTDVDRFKFSSPLKRKRVPPILSFYDLEDRFRFEFSAKGVKLMQLKPNPEWIDETHYTSEVITFPAKEFKEFLEFLDDYKKKIASNTLSDYVRQTLYGKFLHVHMVGDTEYLFIDGMQWSTMSIPTYLLNQIDTNVLYDLLYATCY